MQSKKTLGVRAGMAPVAAGTAIALLASPAHAWIEVGDAPDGVAGSFQTIDTSQGPELTSISGTLAGPGAARGATDDFVDAYLLRVNDTVTFQASTNNAGTAPNFDTMLWLFDASGMGQLANDDVSVAEVRSRLLASSTDGTAITITPGDYILAITGFEFVPLNGAAERIFDIPVSDTDQISGPDGSLLGDDLAEWTNLTSPPGTPPDFGSYFISLSGVGPIPTPGAIGLSSIALAITAGRRRR